MEHKHRKLINDNLSTLVSVTNHLEFIIKTLLENNVINKWMAEYIMTPPHQTNKKRRLYEVIQGRGPQAFTNLCKILEETSNIEARNILLSKSKVFYPSNISLNENMNRLNLNNSINSIKATKHDDNYVKIPPTIRRMDVEHENLPNGVYHMGSNPKGHALIININKVSTKPDEERTGSEVDVNSLKKLLHGLGYDVQIEEDVTQREIVNIIRDFSDVKKLEKMDSVIVVIMSHGEAGKDSFTSLDIDSADGIKINIDWIIEQFVSKKVSKSIPKLFFIQACRGKNSDHGTSVPRVENVQVEVDSIGFGTVKGTSVKRRYEDVFVAYSTVPGYYAKRDPYKGSWFIQKLCEVFRENAWQYDLHTMMMMVDSEVKTFNCAKYGFQTVEWKFSGFNKKFYFNPGLYDDYLESDL
ncbi:caspase-3-like [Adelges cooleyi]|uniref:caspase-3-like n=1 Tax=Adelges cooleyi TaxID=133065 RepID=UPI0021801CA9|nr:caspase-3-like [Adelges cooleyi]